MKYEFGIMSSSFTLESDDEKVAKAAMIYFYKESTAPIMIYDPPDQTVPDVGLEGMQAVHDYFDGDFAKFIRDHSDQISAAVKTIQQVRG